VAELHETNDKALWEGKRSGRPLWKGESFDQYQPTGSEARPCPDTAALKAKRQKPNPGMNSILGTVSKAGRQAAVVAELDHARVAFRDVSRATDSRTVRACLVPPEVVLVNSGPYLAFLHGGWPGRLACLAVLNSLPFDWQARRFVETHLNFFILGGLVVPTLDEATTVELARAAGRLSCVDDRYAEVAESLGVDVGPLATEERLRIQSGIDAAVARAWGLTSADVEVILADFSAGAVSAEHRQLLLDQLS
jgi:hypothetical protein